MANGVGPTLREARKRRKIEISAVEEATRIRPRFLLAIENEEWDVLPGGVYTRGFIRTYATHLGLDGDRLAEDFRREVEGSAREGGGDRAQAEDGRSAGARSSMKPTGWMAIAAVVLIGAIAIVALPGGSGGGRDAGVARRPSDHPAAGGQGKPAHTSQPPVSAMSLRLSAKAEVWVCLLAARGRRLVDGRILEAGAAEGPFHSGSFTVSFGNGEVSMLINGKEAQIPATSSPIGYSIDASGSLTRLSEAERPTCQ